MYDRINFLRIEKYADKLSLKQSVLLNGYDYRVIIRLKSFINTVTFLFQKMVLYHELDGNPHKSLI